MVPRPRTLLLVLLSITLQGCCCCGGGGSRSDPGDELVSAAAQGDAQRVRELLAAGASPRSIRFSSGGSRLGSVTYAVEAAVDSGVWEAVEPLLVDEEAKTRALNRALHFAKLDIAQRLVQKGAKADLSQAFKFYTRALLMGERSQAEALVKLLVELGMDPNATSSSEAGSTPVLVHVVSGAAYSPRAAESTQEDPNVPSWAPEVFILIAKPRLTAEDAHGQTALMKASSAGNEKLVKFLVQQGANPLMLDKDAGAP